MEECSKHVVLIPFPAQGHLMPIIYLAKKLAEHGITATIINIDSIHATVSNRLMSKHSSGGGSIRLESIAMAHKAPQGFNADNLDAAESFFEGLHALELPLADLLAKLSATHTVSCVVSDFYFVSAPHAAARAGIPSVCFWPGMAGWASIQYSHFSLFDAGLVPVDDSNAGKFVSILPGLKPHVLRAMDLPLYYRRDMYIKTGYVKYMPLLMRRQPMDKWILVNSFYELEPEVFDAMQHVVAPARFAAIGPLFPLGSGAAAAPDADATAASGVFEASLRPENRESLGWLDGQSPSSVLYVSFGSIAALAPEELQELVLGIEGSEQPFLMVAFRELAPAMDQESFDRVMERVAASGTGMVVSWAPQLEVLRHRAVGGFLTHCGWNSTLESLSCGVPMLGWPRGADQNTTCKLILEERGFGTELRDKSRGGVREAIRRLMNDEKMRERSLEIRKVVQSAAGKDGSSYENLEEFIKSL